MGISLTFGFQTHSACIPGLGSRTVLPVCVLQALPPLSPCVQSGLWHWWWLCHYFALGALAHLQSPSTSSLLRWQTSHATNASLALLPASLPDASAQIQASFCSVLLCSWWSCIHLAGSSPFSSTSELQMSQFSCPKHSEVYNETQGDSLPLNPSHPLPPTSPLSLWSIIHLDIPIYLLSQLLSTSFCISELLCGIISFCLENILQYLVMSPGDEFTQLLSVWSPLYFTFNFTFF